MKNDIILRHTEEMLQYFDGGDYTTARRETESLREAVLDLLRDSEAKKGNVADIVRLFKALTKKPKKETSKVFTYKIYKHNGRTFAATLYEIAYYADELPVGYCVEGYRNIPSIFFQMLKEPQQYDVEPVEIPDARDLLSEIERHKIARKSDKSLPTHTTYIFDNEKITVGINAEWLLRAMKAGIDELEYIPK